MKHQSSHSPLFLSRFAVPTPIPSALPRPPPVASSTSVWECRVSGTPTVFINQIDCFPQISLKT
ncbi:hypothetical protein D8674_021578 [Pyrus ussuriensis x Pyrus communis]|uniref:Uncharacterized protein n=1 Tax=Pyrus ussuriensis x Pyrus communis TaxID=2448454 RepID=A0A5N5GP10_9ROSA|nr:hypothetical protein D8674_021578 [Pyrus ussuriensis x Pyrus communis]